MTNEDYEAIGGAIREVWELSVIRMCGDNRDAIDIMAWRIATVLEDHDDQFNKHDFLCACGIES